MNHVHFKNLSTGLFPTKKWVEVCLLYVYVQCMTRREQCSYDVFLALCIVGIQILLVYTIYRPDETTYLILKELFGKIDVYFPVVLEETAMSIYEAISKCDYIAAISELF